MASIYSGSWNVMDLYVEIKHKTLWYKPHSAEFYGWEGWGQQRLQIPFLELKGKVQSIPIDSDSALCDKSSFQVVAQSPVPQDFNKDAIIYVYLPKFFTVEIEITLEFIFALVE